MVTDLTQINQREWDRLLGPDDAPLLSWSYLQGLEASGCVGPETAWIPSHIALRRGPGKGGELIAATPAYIKLDSDGEWVYDNNWAEFAGRLGVPYYPKLALCVPYNPVTGRRLLCRPDLPAAEQAYLGRQLLLTARAFCERAGLSSAHLLFPRAEEVQLGPAAGFARRAQEQYHFLNEGYRTFEDYLMRLRPGRRHAIRRERRHLQAAGITVTTHRGRRGPACPDGFRDEDLDLMFAMYEGTSLRYTGTPPYLNRRFFHLCAERLGDRLELVLARARRGADAGHDGQGRVLAGAFNLRGDRRLYGRHWGEAEHVPFLHFEVCFYHSIERCINEGLTAFEPGHGGDQKLLRGFQPVHTYSAHFLRDPRLKDPIEHYLLREVPFVAESMAAAWQRCPLLPKNN